jgi:hypothetical protein
MRITKVGTKLDVTFKGRCDFCGSEFEAPGTELKERVSQELVTGILSAHVDCPHCRHPAQMVPA